jgi:hypothetical protein
MTECPEYTVNARWDDETKTCWTDGEDTLPGLCFQADSFEELIEAILVRAPELLRNNGIEGIGQVVTIKITDERPAATFRALVLPPRLPRSVVHEVTQLMSGLGLDPNIGAAVRRLALDGRMPQVWNELLKRRRADHANP